MTGRFVPHFGICRRRAIDRALPPLVAASSVDTIARRCPRSAMRSIRFAPALIALALAACQQSAPALPHSPIAPPPADLAVNPPSPAAVESVTFTTWQAQTNQLFDELDTNHDGYLEMSELDVLWERLDTNGDGQLDASEAPQLMGAMDLNGDGTITKEEAEGYLLQVLGHPPGPDLKLTRQQFADLRRQIFIDADQNRDGRIQRDEAGKPRLVLFRF
jgi:hypothetical protein